MNAFRLTLTMIFMIGALFPVSSGLVWAALPCNLHEQLESTVSVDTREFSPTPASLAEKLQGFQPANRENATPITFDQGSLRFQVVSAGENVLRCLDYGQEEVLLLNSTPRYRMDTFEVQHGIPDIDLISDLQQTGVSIENVENPIHLENGLYLVDFSAQHNDLWLVGEMVFEDVDGDLYLASTWLDQIRPMNGEGHTIDIAADGLSVESLTVGNGDVVSLSNTRREGVRVYVTSMTGDEFVFEGKIIGHEFSGPAPRGIFYVNTVEPGDYLIVVEADSGESFAIQLVVQP